MKQEVLKTGDFTESADFWASLREKTVILVVDDERLIRPHVPGTGKVMV